ncbi:Guanosine-3',5'-bis(diphosphate) 3'-pyrophosphohydrolase / GTP pyrophosphokinase, (p)ppGpp synthetase II [hydrothermal vent metagenome]|uniref:Guanosine-3',5'-bis(Diphosphate) 3'-pyrophosphohydrolase / GTP pyrophosphokinase, (P)ppGpp synthetase II n=1 Tax=hydrothermal vent metagenome TaxID=652676 RepID=A0A3B0X7N0_9ZZZZ
MAINPDKSTIDVKDLYGDPSRFLISDLCRIIEDYMSTEQVKEVYQAYLFGAQSHEGQFRKTGEPYIYHPIAVARILAEMHMDSKSISAAILHDVIEDTLATKETVAKKFGDDIAELVDGVSKLTELKFKNKKEQQAINIQKVLMAMARDIRVILIKLADRLHNMRTLGIMRPEKRRRIAKETLDIYVPLARRLGINTLRLELEDLGFRAMYPMRYRILEHTMLQEAGHRKELIQKIHNGLSSRLDEMGIEAKVNSRKKHPYSLYKKMCDKSLTYRNIFDVYGMRVIVDSVDDCYRVLGVVHNLFKPIPGKFKDYIAIPKENGYQSLHAVLFGPHAIPIEVQIRTIEMDNFAETGIAAHWLYKENSDGSAIDVGGRTREWLTGLLEMQQAAGDSVEFLENVKVDLFPDELYVYTPRGDIVKLPKNATPVDFAYSVHTDVGHACVSSKVDNKFAPLDIPLYSGQTVEVITSEGATPNPGWLDFVVTAKARSNIRNYLKNIRSEDAVAQGRRLLARILLERNITLEEVSAESFEPLLEEYNFTSLNQLLEDIGMGNRPAGIVARRLFPGDIETDETNILQIEGRTPLAIQGTEGMVVTYGKCCYPIPGDQVIGKISKGRGLVVHQVGCKNIANEQLKNDNMVELNWADVSTDEYSCQLSLHVNNERGVLARLATIISDEAANIEHVQVEDKDGVSTNIVFLIAVKGRDHLARIMRRLRRVSAIMRLYRIQ